MKRYLLKDYIDILKKENLVEDVCLCDSTSSFRPSQRLAAFPDS